MTLGCIFGKRGTPSFSNSNTKTTARSLCKHPRGKKGGRGHSDTSEMLFIILTHKKDGKTFYNDARFDMLGCTAHVLIWRDI